MSERLEDEFPGTIEEPQMVTDTNDDEFTIVDQPEHPMDKNIRFLTEGFPNKDENTKQVQLGVHVEEFTEMLDAIDTIDYETSELLMNARRACRALGQCLKSKDNRGLTYNLPLLLDAMGDQLVTAVSVSLTHGFDIMGALNEISESNLSKFVDGKPTYDEVTGKLLKGPGYKAPDLEQFLPA